MARICQLQEERSDTLTEPPRLGRYRDGRNGRVSCGGSFCQRFGASSVERSSALRYRRGIWTHKGHVALSGRASLATRQRHGAFRFPMRRHCGLMQTLVANARSVCGRYTLLEKLGMGGQGEVWRARDEREGCELALKVLSPTLSRNEGAWVALKREHEIVGRLDHPGILKVYEPERDDQSIVLPMELASGGDLRRLRGASYLEMVPVLIELARALEHAHARGVVHRDLKPGNVLFDADEHVRLADFGVAGTPLSTPRGLSTALSPFTASPAQLLGEPPTVADDVYGLGALIYDLLTGYPPYYPRCN